MRQDITLWKEEASQEGNPYLTEWYDLAIVTHHLHSLYATDRTARTAWEKEFTRIISSNKHEITVRRELVIRYSWAVPCRAAIEALTALSPLVEMGAGAGYWAWLLQKAGADILPFDKAPPDIVSTKNHWHEGAACWTKIQPGTPRILSQYPSRTLFLCWPPYATPMATHCLKHYSGEYLAFIGEGEGGCTADDAFFKLLNKKWKLTEEITIPQFEGLHDSLMLFQRKTP